MPKYSLRSEVCPSEECVEIYLMGKLPLILPFTQEGDYRQSNEDDKELCL